MKTSIQDIKEQASLIGYIEKKHPELVMRRTGDLYKGLCPFHKEDSPSFVITPARNRWKCWGECDEHGDIMDFIMKMEKVEFKEACQMAAEFAGLPYESAPLNPAHEAYKNLMDQHSRRYWSVRKSNAAVQKYLTVDRGLTEETLTKFRVGMVPLDEYTRRKDMGGISGRIAFPILENKNLQSTHCVGMGYRQFGSNTGSKYINDKSHTDDSDPLKGIFVKGDLLYGYPQAKEAITKREMAILVEGYLDVISLHQAGINYTVGSMGTAITAGQIEALSKLTSKVLIYLDGDAAGRANMFKAIPLFYEKGFEVMVVMTETGLDPADVCKNFDFDNMKVSTFIADHAEPGMQVILDRSIAPYESMVTDMRTNILFTLMPILDKLPDAQKAVWKHQMIKRLDMEGGFFK